MICYEKHSPLSVTFQHQATRTAANSPGGVLKYQVVSHNIFCHSKMSKFEAMYSRLRSPKNKSAVAWDIPGRNCVDGADEADDQESLDSSGSSKTRHTRTERAARGPTVRRGRIRPSQSTTGTCHLGHGPARSVVAPESLTRRGAHRRRPYSEVKRLRETRTSVQPPTGRPSAVPETVRPECTATASLRWAKERTARRPVGIEWEEYHRTEHAWRAEWGAFVHGIHSCFHIFVGKRVDAPGQCKVTVYSFHRPPPTVHRRKNIMSVNTFGQAIPEIGDGVCTCARADVPHP